VSWTRPRALRAGDLLAVCAPSGAVDPERLSRGVAGLESLGFRVTVPEGLLEKEAFAAGTQARRRAELLSLFERDDVAGIVSARGGAGSAWLLPLLNPEVMAARPKVFVGYSDATFLHLYLNRLGLVTFHGPMVSWELADGTYHRDSFLGALSGEGPPYASEPDDLVPLRAGAAEGVLRGGCLSILAAAAGTPWALDTRDEDTLLFVEDIHEPPYRLDRFLFQLRASGALARVKGIVFGDMKNCAPKADEGYSLEDVVLRAVEGLDVPVALGLSSGHTASPSVTLPLGIRARLECGSDARFEVLERAVE
jgi:muramoyltetrapeptide carboxypeptidase